MHISKKTLIAIVVLSLILAFITVGYRNTKLGDGWLIERDVDYLNRDSGPSVGVGMGMMGAPVGIENSQLQTEKIQIEPDFVSRPVPIPPYYGSDDALDVEDRVYEQSSNHSVVVDDVPAYLRSMKEYFLSIDGRVLSTNINTGDKYDSGYLYVKVPVSKFTEATSRVTENVKKVYSENVNAQDVTGQVVSVEEQLEKLEDERTEKEIELVEAKTTAEKRRIELELQRIQARIDSVQKQQDSVEQRVTYSAISISVAGSERYFNPNATPDLWTQFDEALSSLGQIAYVLASVAIWVVVYSVIWIPLLVVIKLFKRTVLNTEKKKL